MSSVGDFLPRARSMHEPRILELGTRRSDPDKSTRHDDLISNAGEFIGTDFQDGIDVDVVADVHVLSEVFGEKTFDIVLSFSTLEHIKYPHVAAHEIMKTLKVGGLLFIQTHQTFPLHSFPSDYFRFSVDALANLFGTRMGFVVLGTEYQFPVEIHSDELGILNDAYLNVHLYGEKIGETPAEYIYDFGPKIGVKLASLRSA